MDLTLKRTEYGDNGIFSDLLNETGDQIAVCAEHSYGGLPKLPNGAYTCVRGQHQLEEMTTPFETFEITEVPNHTGILFHRGNTQDDSAGCVLLGKERQGDMITESRLAFAAFMNLQNGIDQFQLIVE